MALDIGYAAGRALADAFRAACQQGLGSLIRAGLLGYLPGAAKLDRISFLDPADRDEGVRVTLRWEAPGVCGASAVWAREQRTEGYGGPGLVLTLAGAVGRWLFVICLSGSPLGWKSAVTLAAHQADRLRPAGCRA